MSGLSPFVKHKRRPTPPLRPAVRRLCSRLLRDARGATAVEYGLIVALIVIAMIASFQTVASTTVGMWGNVNTKIATATGH